jgi:hypothetical protein
MTYYETANGAKVFAAGAFTLAGAATWQPVERMLENLWTHLARPQVKPRELPEAAFVL